MATEKILNTRLMLKYDSYANWIANDPVLKAGEMAVATVANNDANKSTGFTNLPNIVLKVGDGTSKYSELKFVSALAADVHGWAKEASKPTYEYTEIGGLADELARVSAAADTDTHYTLVATDAENHKYELRSKEKSATEWTKVADLDLSGLVSRVKALEDLVGTTKVADQITNAINALDNAGKTVEQGEIISSVSQTDGVISVEKRALVKEDIPNIEQAQVNGLPKALEDLSKAVSDGDAKALADAKEYSDGKLQAAIQGLDKADEAVENQFVTAVSEADGVITVSRAQATIANISGLETRLAGIEGNVTNLENNKQDNLAFEGTYDKESNKVVTKSHLTSIIEGLDYAGGEHGTSKFVTKVTEADGVIAAEYAQPVIADIAGLNDRLSGIDGEIAKKQDALTFTSTPNASDNRVATEKFVLESVADLNGAMHFVGSLDAIPSDNTQYAAGDVILVGYDEYVFDGTEWKALGNESIYKTKEEAKSEHEALTKLVTDLESKHDQEMDTLEKKHDDELKALDDKYKAAIEGLDADKVTAGAGEIIDSIVEVDGVVTATKRALVAADIPELAQSKITGLTDKIAEIEEAIGSAESGALKDAQDYADNKVKTSIEALDKADTAVEKQFVTAVSETDGIITVSRAALKATDIPTIEQSQVNGLVDALNGKEAAGEAAKAEAAAKKYADDQLKAKVEALDYADAEVEKNVVTAVSETDGVIAVTRKPLADIAWSGEVKDLKQTDTVLILNCGNSFIGKENEFVM